MLLNKYFKLVNFTNNVLYEMITLKLRIFHDFRFGFKKCLCGKEF